jgi:hypothetical protein
MILLFKSVVRIGVYIFHKIFENWQAKLGSILIAILFYLNLQTSKILVKTIEIPIEYPKLPQGMYYAKNLEKTFKIRVEGFKDIVNYRVQFMKVTIDPTELKVGENTIEVKKIWGASSNKIKVTPLGGPINILIEQVGTKTIPVDVTFENDLPSNYYRPSYFIKPSSITLAGPKNLLDKVNKYNLGIISLKDVKESFTRSIKPSEPLKGLSIVGGMKEFQVRVNIIKGATDSGEQTIRGIAIKCEKLDENLIAEFSVEEVSMRFNSNSSLNSAQIFEGVKAVVTCSNYYDTVEKRIMPNSLPVLSKIRILKSPALRNMEIISIMPDKVTITYRAKNSVSAKTDLIPKEDETRSENLPEPPEDRK